MQVHETISDKKLEKLAKHVAKEFMITQAEALEIIYEEWDTVEKLYDAHKKTKAVKGHLVKEINTLYRIA